MPLLSLGESLARSKDRWKKRLKIRSKATTRGAISLHQDIWPSIRSLLGQLESSATVFAPLKSVISVLERCAGTFEGLSKEQNNYEELRKNIDGILKDMSMHMSDPIGHMMTDSVKLICLDIEAELNTMEERQGSDTERRLVNALSGIDVAMEGWRQIEAHLRRLNLNLNLNVLRGMSGQATELKLSRMSPTMSAIYNSAESDSIKRGRCTQGTRKPQVDLLLDWARTPDAGKTCWINGMAGTGKTTIAYTICSELEKTCQLGASFFCSRTMPECRQVKNIIPSIAYQLARFSLPFRHALARALELDADVHARAVRVQYEKLVVEPLMEVQSCLPVDFIVVIDALDECENEDSVGRILDLLMSTSSIVPIRFLISSRPEPCIIERMTGRAEDQDEVRLTLDDLDPEIVRVDIEAYIRHELQGLPLSETQLSRIIQCCGLLFVYASITCRYINQAYEIKELYEAVDLITNSASTLVADGRTNSIDELYMRIVGTTLNRHDKDTRGRMKAVLDAVICAIQPMTIAEMTNILGLESTKKVDALLAPFRSVLNVAKDTRLVTTIHASYVDFMISPNRSTAFSCNPVIQHKTMAEACLRMIKESRPWLNICKSPSSYLLDYEVENFENRVSESIPAGLAYACRYWSTHLQLCEYLPGLADCVWGFFRLRLLVWMEAMSVTKQIRYVTSVIQHAEKWCIEHKAPEDLIAFAHDASQFVSVFAGNPVSQSIPHIYVSMLPFWPRSRPISTAYMPRTSGLVRPTGTAIDRRQLALISTWKISTRRVESMSLTANGDRLVAPSENSIEVYDTTTGESVLSLTDERARNVQHVAVSPNGARVVFSGNEGIAYLWDMRNGGTVTQLLPDDISGVLCIAFSRDGSLVACGRQNGELCICRLQQDVSSVVRITGHPDWVRSVAFSPNGLHLASGSHDRTIRVWNVQTGHPVGEPFEGHIGYVQSVSYSDDGSRLASASEDKTILVWDSQTGRRVLGPLTAHSNDVSVFPLPGGASIMSRPREDTTRIWDAHTGQIVPEPITAHSDNVSSVSFSPRGAFIASGSWDHNIRVYDAHTGHTVLGPLHGHTDVVNQVTYSSDGTRLYSCSNDGTVRIWDAQSRDAQIRDAHDDPPPVQAPLGPIYSIRYSHGGSRVASGLHDGTVRIWDGRTGELLLGPLRGHDNPVVSLDYSPDDKCIATASYDSTLRIWDASTGNHMRGPMYGHNGHVNHVRFSPDGSLIATGSSDGTVRVWDVSTRQQVAELFSGKSIILSVGFSPDGRQVVCGSRDRIIRVLHLQTGDMAVGPIHGHDNLVRSVEFSSDGTRLVSGSDDKSVGIWDAKTGKELFVCGERKGSHSPHSNIVLSVSFSPDGRYVASGSSDRAVRVWDARNGRLILGPLMGHTGWVRCVQFSPDGSHVISCSSDGTIRFWDVSSCRLNSQEATMSTDGSEMDEIGSLGKNGLSSFSLNDDGWLFDSQGRRLLWVPSDLRDSLIHPPTDLLIGDRGFMKLDFDGAKLGDLWADCYLP